MQYRFPIYGKGENGPVEFPGSCEACYDYKMVSKVVEEDILPGWEYCGEWVFDLAAKRGMRIAAEQVGDDVDVIVPWTSERLPLAPGCNEFEMAARVLEAGKDVKPYHVKGTGKPLGVYMYRKATYGTRPWVAMRAPGAWVRAFGPSISSYDQANDMARKVSAPLLPTQRQVVFVFREFPICGATLAATHICNGLNRLGWNATIACTKLDPAQAKLFPFEFGPMVFKGLTELVRSLSLRADKTSVVIAPVHAMVDTAENISDMSGAELFYYVQDDERRFRHIRGALYYKADAIMHGWDKVAGKGTLVANSSWVTDMLRDRCDGVEYVPIGVSTGVFKPGDRSKPPFKIMAHCRPSTPRRGWAFICSVLNQLAVRGLDFEAITYDEQPVGLQILKHKHLGRLSPDGVAKAMSSAHVFIEGSDVQGFGMQALEAMSSGCALVCTNNKGIDTFGVNGKNCVIVQHGDVGVAADAVMNLATNLDLRKSIGQSAREQALKFEWREVCKAWDCVLRRKDAVNDEKNP